MKKLVLIAAVALAVAAATAIPAEARGYTCKYSSYGAIVVIDGYDNSAMLCRSFAKGGMRRYYGGVTGRVYCAWAGRELDVRTDDFVSGA